MNQTTTVQLRRIRLHVYSPPADVRYDLDTLARLAEVHPDLVSRYVQLGLLDPVREGDVAGGRFDEAALRRLRRIQRMRRELGVNVNGVGVILELLSQIDELQRRLGARESTAR